MSSFAKSRFILFSTTLVLGLLLAGSATGQGVSIVNIDPATQYDFNEIHGNGMVGWNFYVTQPITITQVGWYDDAQNGLTRDFQIGLWQDLSRSSGDGGFFGTNPNSLIGDPIDGLTIPGGTGASLNGAWRVVDLVAPLTLIPGSYQLGGLDTASTSDPIRYQLAGMNPPIPGVTIGCFFYAGSGFTPTTTLGLTHEYYVASGLELGPMLFTSVPEPVSGILIVVGALVLFCHRPRMHRRIT